MVGYDQANVDHVLASSHHASTNGVSERGVQTVKTLLRALIPSDSYPWIESLPQLEYSYNTTVHSSTRFSPFELLFGHKPVGISDFLSGRPLTTHRTLDDWITHLQNINVIAIDNMLATQSPAAARYDPIVPPPTFHVGDLVVIHRNALTTPDQRQLHTRLKSRNLYSGPFKIIRTFPNPNIYEIDFPPTIKVPRVVNVENLKPCPSSTLFTHNSSPPPVYIDSSGEFYCPEKLLSHRVIHGKNHYFVQWEGYPLSAATWEPLENLVNCDDLIQQFHSAQSISNSTS